MDVFLRAPTDLIAFPEFGMNREAVSQGTTSTQGCGAFAPRPCLMRA